MSQFTDEEAIEQLRQAGKYPPAFIPVTPKFSYGQGSPSDANKSILTSVNHHHVPKLPFFSGEVPPLKGDVSYREWRYEVMCHQSDENILEASLLQGMRRSLKGTPRQTLIPLGKDATVDTILGKFDVLYGDVSSNGMIMQEFFNCGQKQNESATDWACRLETLLQTAVEAGHIGSHAVNDMLRHKFFASLRSSDLKSQCRHKYDNTDDFQDLLREVRIVERELNTKTELDVATAIKKPQAQALVSEESVDSKIDKKLAAFEKKLDDKFANFLNRLAPPDQGHAQGQGQARSSGRYGFDQPHNQNQGYNQGQNRGRNQGRSQGRNQGYNHGYNSNHGHSQGENQGYYPGPGRGRGNNYFNNGNGRYAQGN